MHIADMDLGILGANGIVGAGITIAAGAALTAQFKGTDRVALCFFGDGASNTARFHEGINLAACWKLPVVYVIENNMYANSTPITTTCQLRNIADRACGYGIPGVNVDGTDVIAVYEAVGEAVARARRGEGPTLVECKVCRQLGHHQGDPQTYRSKKEIEECIKRDPIPKFRKRLLEMGVLPEKDAERIHQEIDKEIDKAVKFAEESPLPEAQDVVEDVYV